MGTLALANMVPKIEPESQWTTASLSQALTPSLSFCSSLWQQTFSDSLSINLTCIWMSENWLARRGESVSKFSDRLSTMSAFKIRQASTWPTIAREVGDGPDGSGHPSDWQGRGLRETHNQRKCIALWRACQRATSFHLSQTKQSTKPQQVSLQRIQRVAFLFIKTCNCVQQRNDILELQ